MQALLMLMAALNTIPTGPAVWRIADIVREHHASMTIEELHEAEEILSNRRIELMMRPSEKPGEENGKQYPGAGPKSLDFQHHAREGYLRLSKKGANRAAKTTTVGGSFCEHLRDRARDGETYWVIAQDWKKMWRTPQRLMWDLMPRSMFGGLVWTEGNGFGLREQIAIELPDDRGTVTLAFLNEQMQLDKFESEKVAGVWWTEASREAIYDSLITRLSDSQGFLWIDYLPKFAWLKYRVALNPLFKAWSVGMADNAHNLPDGTVASVIEEFRGQEAEIAVRVYGEDASAFGAVYPQFRRDRHVVEPFYIDESCPWYGFYDYGFRNPSAFGWCRMLPRGFVVPAEAGPKWGGVELDHEVLVVVREMHRAGLSVEEQAEIILAESGAMGAEFEYDPVADPSIFNTTLTQYRDGAKSIGEAFEEAGLRLKRGARASGPDGHSLVSRVRTWLEHDKVWFFSTCEKSIREHESWRYKEDADGNAPGNEPFEDKDNHSCDGLKELIAENPTAERGSRIVFG